MPTIGTTRFNNKTWAENKRWREKNKYEGGIYGSPVCINQKVPLDELMFVLEMQNEENKIGGISMIKNINYADKYYRIYSDGNYNRYIYKSAYRIDRNELSPYENKIMEIFDHLLFKGARHLKRGQGITTIPNWLLNTKHINFIHFFKSMFTDKFGKKIC